MTRSILRILCLSLAVVAFTGCSGSPSGTSDASDGAGEEQANVSLVAPRYITVFGSVQEFVELPELIAVARVESEREGDARQSEEVTVSERVLILDIEESLTGPAPSQVEVVDFGSVMTPQGRQEQAAEDGIRLRPGDRALVAISRYGEKLRFVNNQAVYLLADGEVTDTDRDDPVIRSIERMSEKQIKDKVSEGRRPR